MPQNSSVDKILAGAKAELNKANTMASSMPKPAAPAATPAVKPAPAQAPTTMDELKAKEQNVKQYTDALPKMHSGGPVRSDGAYQLKAGEHVLTAKETAKVRKHAMMASGLKSLSRSSK